MATVRCLSYAPSKGDQCKNPPVRGGIYCGLHIKKGPKPFPPQEEPSTLSNTSSAVVDVEIVPVVDSNPSGHNASPPLIKTIPIKVEASEDLFEPQPLKRTSTWKDRFRWSFRKPPNPQKTETNNDEAENVLIGMGFAPTTRSTLLGYLAKTRLSKESLYIAISPPDESLRFRIKIGRTANLERRKQDYQKCGMDIVYSIRMPNTLRVEACVLKLLKAEFKNLGNKSAVPIIQKIQDLGRSVNCPCGKKHNDMFLTKPDFQFPGLDKEQLEKFIKDIYTLEKMDAEDFFTPEITQYSPTAAGEPTSVEEEANEGRFPQRATSEERKLEIQKELHREQTHHAVSWQRNPDTNRLIRV